MTASNHWLLRLASVAIIAALGWLPTCCSKPLPPEPPITIVDTCHRYTDAGKVSGEWPEGLDTPSQYWVSEKVGVWR